MAEPKKTMITLNQALLGAQMALKAVGKDAKNSFHGYNYTSSEGMIQACREALHHNNLFVRRTAWRFDATVGEFGMLISTMVLTHADSGESISDEIAWMIVPEKGRPIDKALAGSLTTSLNYYLRDLLQVPREEETMDSRDDRTFEPKRQSATQTPATPKPTQGPSSALNRLREKASSATVHSDSPSTNPRKGQGAPVSIPESAPASGGDDGEYLNVTFQYVDRKQSKKGTDYIAAKTRDGSRYVCFDENLLDTIEETKGKAIQVLVEPGENGNPDRILEIRSSVGAGAQQHVAVNEDEIPF